METAFFWTVNINSETQMTEEMVYWGAQPYIEITMN
jgi:hypothetical protein